MPDNETILAAVTLFTDKAHGSQLRRYQPHRYIVHPLRVMETCRAYTTDITVLSASILHDVLEDTPVTEAVLREFLLGLMEPARVTKSMLHVIELTDVYTKARYPALNRRVRKNKEADRLSRISPDAQTIKYADILDNTTDVVEHDPDFARRFLPEYKYLLSKMNKGNQQLYAIVQQRLEECFQLLKGKKV